MKKLISIILLLAMFCTLFACSPKKGGDETTDDTTVPVTNPDGFEEVTTPSTDKKPEDTTAADTTAADTTAPAPEITVKDADAAVARAREWLGETDPDTGYKYAYSYDGSMIENGKPFFRIRVSWFIEEQERYSLCGYLLVGADGTVTKYSW